MKHLAVLLGFLVFTSDAMAESKAKRQAMADFLTNTFEAPGPLVNAGQDACVLLLKAL